MTKLTIGRINFAPLSAPLSRFTIGYESLFDEILRMQDTQTNQSNYPPYNIVKYSENEYSIEFAVAGFDYSDIDVSIEGDVLTIIGEKIPTTAATDYLYRGISQRSFERKFTLGSYLEVKDAVVKNGMLTVKLERIVPDALKPRKIAITSGD
jgi:molecular chaperone IbpA